MNRINLLIRNSFFICLILFVACGGSDEDDSPSGGNEYLNVADINIPTGNTTATMYIKASDNCEWTVSCGESWVSFSETKGRGDLNVTVTVTTNPSSTSSREAKVVISSKTLSRTITISQSPSSESLEISPTSMVFTSVAESKDVVISSNTHWTISGNANWIILNKTEGENNGTVTITVKDNESSETRSAEILFMSTSITKQLSVVQVGVPSTLEGVSVPQVIDVGKHDVRVKFDYKIATSVTSYGICYSTSGDPTIANLHVSEQTSSSSGSPTIEISGLSSVTTYFIRAYVVSQGGIQYSATTQFTTMSSQPGNDDNVPPGL